MSLFHRSSRGNPLAAGYSEDVQNLMSMMQLIAQRRATGLITVTASMGTHQLGFLFGHLFMANGPAISGDDEVNWLLNQIEGVAVWDPHAKLPPVDNVSNALNQQLFGR